MATVLLFVLEIWMAPWPLAPTGRTRNQQRWALAAPVRVIVLFVEMQG